MTQATIVATIDGYVASASATYATAAAGYVAGFSNTSGTSWITGQRLNAGTYTLHQASVRWALTAIPTGAIITAASIRVTNSGSPPAGRLETYFKDRDPGAVISTADYVDQATLSGLDTFATMPTANNGSDTVYTLTGTAALRAKIQANIGGNIGCMVVSAGQVSSSAPSADERWSFQSVEDATEGDRPALIVDYRMPPVMDHHYRMMRAA